MDLKKVYITHATSKYLQVAHNLAKSIREFSNIPIVIYCLNTDTKDTYIFQNIKDVYIERLTLDIKESDVFSYNETGNFYIDRQNINIYHILSFKIKAIDHALNSGWDEVCYLDSDCIATPIIDELFDYSNKITDYPLSTKGVHEYMTIIEDGVVSGNPFEGTWPVADNTKSLEYPLMNFMLLNPNNRGVYKTTNIILSNQNCKEFIKTWWETSQILPKITDVRKITPYHEETIFNVLTWRNETVSVPQLYINLQNGFESVKDFYSIDSDFYGFRNYDDNNPSSHFYKIPENKRDIKVLHGEKLTSECDKIILYLKELKQNGYFKN
jgi:hypothetical protein